MTMCYTNPRTLLFLHMHDGPCHRASCIAAPTRVGIIVVNHCFVHNLELESVAFPYSMYSSREDKQSSTVTIA